MGKYVAENIVKSLIKAEKAVKGSRVAIFGFAFKENCPDVRNSKVYDIVCELKEYGIDPMIIDPIADSTEVKMHYNLSFSPRSELVNLDAVVFAVAHKEFLTYSFNDIDAMYREGERVLVDINGLFSREDFEKRGYVYWRM
jgi:UDP-N-acetyl-D-galactosamine dehydrogenase